MVVWMCQSRERVGKNALMQTCGQRNIMPWRGLKAAEGPKVNIENNVNYCLDMFAYFMDVGSCSRAPRVLQGP